MRVRSKKINEPAMTVSRVVNQEDWEEDVCNLIPVVRFFVSLLVFFKVISDHG